MKLIFVGSGSAFTTGTGNYHSNMLLVPDDNDNTLLIDCGSDVRHALQEINYTYKDIKNVYVSHLHSDHAGGLEWLALTNNFDVDCTKPNLYANENVIKKLWPTTLSGGLNTIQGKRGRLENFFHLHPIKPEGFFSWEGVRFQTIQTMHVLAGFSFMPSYGLIFTINNTTILITTDTQFSEHQMNAFYQQADIIFHDCETSVELSGVHPHYKELLTLSSEYKSKMWLYHYNPGELPDAEKDGFLGFVQRGQVFEF